MHAAIAHFVDTPAQLVSAPAPTFAMSAAVPVVPAVAVGAPSGFNAVMTTGTRVSADASAARNVISVVVCRLMPRRTSRSRIIARPRLSRDAVVPTLHPVSSATCATVIPSRWCKTMACW
jgi:hypothetical protein